MVVNGLEVFGFSAIGQNARLCVELFGGVANDVLDKLRVVIGIFCNEFFVVALESAPKFTGSGCLGDANLLLE